jgi:hypothetical protein
MKKRAALLPVLEETDLLNSELLQLLNSLFTYFPRSVRTPPPA